MSEKLKPCPFCGSENLIESATGALEIRGATYQSCWIECDDCGADGPVIEVTDERDSSYQLVRDAWNKRF